MKVLLANLQKDYGGAEIHVRMLAKALHHRGHQVTLLCHPDGKLRDNALQDGVPVETMRVRNQLDLSVIARFIASIRQHRPDVLHLHTPKEYIGGTLAARLMSTPLILTRHMLLPLKPLMRAIYKQSNGVLCLSRGLQSLLLSQGLPIAQLPLVYGAIDTEPFVAASQISSEVRSTLRAEMGVGEQDVAIGCVGRLVGGKGQDVLLNAFARLQHLNRSLKLILVGDGAERGNLEAQAARLNLGESVRFAGFRSDIPTVLALLDIVVVPSTATELFPLSVLEGMAVGRPLVATSVGGVPEIITEPTLGRLVPPGDPVTLADTLALLVEDASLRTQIGASGAEYARKQFGLNRFIEEVEEVYQNACTLSGRRS